jgi:carbonic anhydrase
VLTCIDSRIDPAKALGFDVGDAHVIRNAGGRATDDAVRSLLISRWLFGSREFLVIHHPHLAQEEGQRGDSFQAHGQIVGRSGPSR